MTFYMPENCWVWNFYASQYARSTNNLGVRIFTFLYVDSRFARIKYTSNTEACRFNAQFHDVTSTVMYTVTSTVMYNVGFCRRNSTRSFPLNRHRYSTRYAVVELHVEDRPIATTLCLYCLYH